MAQLNNAASRTLMCGASLVAVLWLVLFHHLARAQQPEPFDPMKILSSTGEKGGAKGKDSDVRFGPQLVALPEPPRSEYDDCVLKGLKSVSSDVAARSIKTSCEAKQAAAIASRRQKYDQEFGPSVTIDNLLVEQVSIRDGRARVVLKSVDPRGDHMVTYVRLIVWAPPRERYGCKGEYKAFGLLLNLRSGRSMVADLPLHYSAAAGEPCVEVDMLRSRESSWVEGVRAATVLTVRPMSDDYLLPYTRSP